VNSAFKTLAFPLPTILYKFAPAKNAPTIRNNPPSANRISLKTKYSDLNLQNGNNLCKTGRWLETRTTSRTMGDNMRRIKTIQWILPFRFLP